MFTPLDSGGEKTHLCMYFIHMLYMVFIFIRVGFSVEINQSRFRDALIYGKRILADRGFRIKGGTKKTGILLSLCFSPPT